MFYVYIIQSQKDKSLYFGTSSDLKERFKNHNAKRVKSTASKTPYKLLWYCAFTERTKAYNFERYLKSGSGGAFLRKRLI
jgi:predicted GIY-YIG superfamily endonuclease